MNKKQMKESKTTGEILREKREKKGLLLRQVAALLDIDTAILSKIERSERKASKEQIIKLAKILELDEEDLIVQFLSEKILYEIKDEELGSKALKVAEQKMKYVSRESNSRKS
ncbi:helix-turn-helix domain-containing protein [Yeosuana sp. AK3]